MDEKVLAWRRAREWKRLAAGLDEALWASEKVAGTREVQAILHRLRKMADDAARDASTQAGREDP